MFLKNQYFINLLITNDASFTVLSAFAHNKTVMYEWTVLIASTVTLFSFHGVCSIREEIKKQSCLICVKNGILWVITLKTTQCLFHPPLNNCSIYSISLSTNKLAIEIMSLLVSVDPIVGCQDFKSEEI